ncbi:MAG: Na+/H+ antiporter subunit E [Hyphomicrobiales bacterium]|nr:Na+/H+ antiporter subunit E [Hyphomicrobiales bacterium]
MIAGIRPTDLIIGAAAAGVATWASLLLYPAGAVRISLLGVLRAALRVLGQAPVAGVDVAWRALDPRLPLHPGVVTFRPRLPPGTIRHVFCTLTSLAPGVLPGGSEGDVLLIHCLDVEQPVVAQLSEDESLLLQASEGGRTDE